MQKGVDFIGVTVIYFCHDGKGNVVFSKRGKNCRDEQGTWDIGGGSMEFGDTVLDTLKKEIKEEYCTDVLDYEFLGYQDVHRVYDGKKTHWIALSFKVLVDREKVKNGEPHKFDAVEWFTLGNMPQPQHSQMSNFLKLFKDKLK
jgi:ADP-ribose pyrophosphatase YjhB (NUDIX family)